MLWLGRNLLTCAQLDGTKLPRLSAFLLSCVGHRVTIWRFYVLLWSAALRKPKLNAGEIDRETDCFPVVTKLFFFLISQSVMYSYW